MIFFEYSIPLPWIIAVSVATAGAGLYSAWLFIRNRRDAAMLSLLFVLSVILLFWIMLQPGKRDVVTELLKPRFVIAFDISRSMTIAPTEEAANRWDAAREALKMPWTSIVGQECDIELVPFASKVGQSLKLSDADSLSPTGSATRLRDSLKEIAGRYTGLNVAGILLLSDGLDTREAFDEWASAPTPFPIHTVRLEDDTDWELPPDLRIEAVATPLRATRNWTTELKAIVYGQGAGSHPVTVQLFKDGLLEEETPTRIPPKGGSREVVFKLEHPLPGVFDYRVFAPPLPGEANTNDNEFIVSVHVAEDSNRLLYVEGVPRWEYKFLRRALIASQDVIPTIFFIGPDGQPRNGTPAGDVTANMTESELANFKVVILGNLDAAELTDQRADNLVNFVETGGSLILLGGNKGWGEDGFNKTSLRKILPVTSHAFEPLESDVSAEAFQVRITAEARVHPAFAGDAVTWDELPSVLSVFPHATPSLGAQVLAEAETPQGNQPVVLSHRYGEGKVAAIFTDSLWRWQLSPETLQTKPYPRFWTQLTAWMLPDEDDIVDKKRLHLFADRDSLFLGEEVELSARPPDSDDKPPEVVEVRITFPDEREVPFPMTPRQIITPSGESFSGFAIDFAPDLPGHYTAAAAARDTEEESTSDPISFFVLPHSFETAPRPINENVLETLARSGSGSFFRDLNEMNDGLSALRIAAIEEEQSKVVSLWQRWLVIGLLMALLGGAWTMRKLKNMP